MFHFIKRQFGSLKMSRQDLYSCLVLCTLVVLLQLECIMGKNIFSVEMKLFTSKLKLLTKWHYIKKLFQTAVVWQIMLMLWLNIHTTDLLTASVNHCPHVVFLFSCVSMSDSIILILCCLCFCLFLIFGIMFSLCLSVSFFASVQISLLSLLHCLYWLPSEVNGFLKHLDRNAECFPHLPLLLAFLPSTPLISVPFHSFISLHHWSGRSESIPVQ